MTVATAPRTRRVRCTAGVTASGLQTTGCTELFAREQLTEGLCSRCRSIEERVDANGQTFLAITEPVYIDEQERAQYQIGRGTEAPACAFPACDGQGCQDDDPYSGHSPTALARLEATYPAETVTTHEVRCRTCPEWVADGVAFLNDGRCNDCHDRWMHEQDAERETAATETEEMARDEREAASQEAQRIIEEQMVTSVSTTRTPLPAGWQPSVWQVNVYIGRQLGHHVAAHLTFDEAQKLAKTTAKAEADDYNAERTGEGHQPEKARWVNVKRWNIAGGDIAVIIEKI